MDFPAEFYAKKGLTSCVRRRKWVRHRRYVATNSWSAVPGIHKDMSEEPFIDVRWGKWWLSRNPLGSAQKKLKD
jgi:tectonin beta-propeller repeat-containing protein 1